MPQFSLIDIDALLGALRTKNTGSPLQLASAVQFILEEYASSLDALERQTLRSVKQKIVNEFFG